MSTQKLRYIFKLRGWLLVPPVFFVALCTYGEVESGWIVFPLGGIIFLAGLMLRLWAQMHLHYRLKIRNHLTTTGPYVYVRNPIYIANTLMMVGLCALSELLWFCPVMLLWCVVLYRFVVRYEESHLLNKYGSAYEEYLGKVSRWLPAIANPQGFPRPSARKFLYPSIVAEFHNFWLVIPFVLKELLSRR